MALKSAKVGTEGETSLRHELRMYGLAAPLQGKVLPLVEAAGLALNGMSRGWHRR